jgi:hypothetical protein
MKAAIELGLVIAERKLTDVQTDQRVLVSVGTPQCIGDGWDWACPYIITGLGEPIHGHAHGIVALQSLQLVSTAIRADLERTHADLRFLDQSNWQSAFPKAVQDLGEADLRTRIDKLTDDEQIRWLAERGLPSSGQSTGGNAPETTQAEMGNRRPIEAAHSPNPVMPSAVAKF